MDQLPDTIRYIVVEDGVGFPEYPCFEHRGYVLKPVYNSTTFYFLPHEYVYSSGEIIEDFLPEGLKYIAPYACYSNSIGGIDLVIPEGYEEIGDYAFYYTEIPKVVLPETMKKIGAYAFSSLGEINIPESLEEVGEHTFDSYPGWTPLYNSKIFFHYPYNGDDRYTIPDGIEKIADNAFSNSKNITEINFPSSVKEIGDNAFGNCTYLEHIELPASLESIGDGAFYGCSLRSLVLPDNVTSIGSSVFSNCDSLTEVTLPANLKSIPEYAFYSCEKLQKAVLPEGLERIEKEAFGYCYALTDINFPMSISYIGPNGVNAAILTPSEPIYTPKVFIRMPTDYSGEYTVPEGIDCIYDYAFSSCQHLSAVHFPNSLKDIRTGAFQNCDSLTSIALPEGVTRIGTQCFSNCDGLSSVNLPGTLEIIEFEAFSYCTSLTEIKLSDAITNLEGYTFYGTQLTHVQLPANVKTISDDAFNDCNKLSSLSIAESNTSFDTYKGILYNEGMTEIEFIPQGITEMDLPETLDIEEVFSSHSHDLENFPNLRTLTLRAYDQPLYHLFRNFDYDSTAYYYNQKGEDGVTRDISEYHYSLPDNLEKLVLYCDSFSTQLYYETINSYGDIYRRITHLDGIDTVEIHATTYFDPTALNGLAKTVKAMIFDGINILPSNCFAEMDSLQSLTITQAQTMEAGCMANLVNLKELTLPYAGAGSASTASSFGELFSSVANDKMQRVVQFLEDGTSVTYYVPLIEKLTLTEGLTTLPYGALYNCSMLQQVTLPSSLYMVGDKAFYGCAGLTDIYCKGAEPASAYSGTFDGVRVNSCVLHVPYNASEMYRRSTGWEKFYYIEEEAPISITVIKNIENAGVIYGLQEYQLGETAELQAVANSGYTFSGWTENGEMISEESTYTFTVEGDRSLIAVFTPVSGSNDVSTTPGSNQVSFTWTAEEGASTYRLDVFTDEAMTQLAGSLLFDANGQIIKRAVSTTLTATIDGLSPLTNYYYRMTAYDETEQAISQYTGTFSTTQATALEADGEISAVSVQTRQDGVEICHAEGLQVHIVNASGMTVTSLTADSDSMNIPLEKGFYIIVVGNSTYKIMI